MKTRKRATSFDFIDYNPRSLSQPRDTRSSISVIGIDTEAYTTGETFMICTSDSVVMTPDEFLPRMFSHQYRNKIFVAYNLKYEMSAFLRYLPQEQREELRETNKTEYDGHIYEVIGTKRLIIRKGRYRVTFYDILQFYNTSLRKASENYLSERKLESEVNEYTPEYVNKHYNEIRRYCIRDARLAQQLAELVIKTFEGLGVNVRSLISTANVSWRYFRKTCNYEHVKWMWDNTPMVLEYAHNSYHGGKFEVTRRGIFTLHEYDIVSAYPYEISQLISIKNAHVFYHDRYSPDATYGFYDVTVSIPPDIFSPIPVKLSGTVIYPAGRFRTFLTLSEYRWLLDNNIDHTLHDCIELFCKTDVKPFHDEIVRLTELKHQFKLSQSMMEYQGVKILMNSLYGKFAQLIPDQGRLKAGDSWNPIFASEITARTRIRVTDMQNRYPSVIAVHTDSITSTKKLDIPTGSALGEWEYSKHGKGLMFGCGIYQIGDKSKFRGFSTKTPLLDMIPKSGKTWSVPGIRPKSWREVTFREMDPDYINRFMDDNKTVSINVDKKRVWLDDWEDYADLTQRKPASMPHLIVE